MPWPKGRPRSDAEKAKIAAGMEMTGGRRRAIHVRLQKGWAEVPLSDVGLVVALVDIEDVGLVEDRSWHLHRAGYAAAARNGRPLYMHRVILEAPDGVQVDHINGNRLDNRRANLRLATVRQQRGNQIARPGSRSAYRGVTAAVGKAHPWAARVGRMSLGAYATEEDAARAVDAELVQQFGPYARLNLPEAR